MADAIWFAGFVSAAEMWIDNYEELTFENQLDAIFLQISPLFVELHTFVRHALSAKYGEEVVPTDGPIPMHLLGNMWAQSWEDVSELSTIWLHHDHQFNFIFHEMYFAGGQIRNTVPTTQIARYHYRNA